MAIAVAPGNKPNTLRLQTLKVCRLRFPSIPEKKPRKEGETSFPLDDLLKGVSLEVLKNAYVVLIRVGTADGPIAPVSENATLARTSANGELLWIEASELKGEPPTGPSRRMLFDRGSRYAMFWTNLPDLAGAVWQDTRRDASTAVVEHPFSRMSVRPRGTARQLPKHFDVRGGNRLKLDMLVSDTNGQLGDVPVHGMYRGSVLQPLCTDCEPNSDYVIARSDCISAVYLCELMNRATDLAQEACAKNWMAIGAAEDVARHARNKLRNAQLDDDLSKVRFKGKNYASGPWQEKYLDYAYACAAVGVPLELFVDALRVSVLNDDWIEHAKQIEGLHKIRHPNCRGDNYYNKTEEPLFETVVSYFNFYAFGFTAASASWLGNVAKARKTISQRFVDIEGRCKRFQASRMKYGRLIKELHAQYDGQRTVQADLHEAYHDIAMRSKYPWWEDFDAEEKGLTAYLDKTATLFDKMGELLGRIFADKDRINAINAVLEESIPKFEKLFEKMSNYNKRFSGETIERKLRDGLNVEANFVNSSLTIRQAGAEPIELQGIKFLVDQDVVETFETKSLPPKKSGAMKRRFKKVPKKTSTFRVRVPEVPFRTLHRWPSYMAALGDSIALYLTIQKMRETHGKTLAPDGPGRWEIWGKLSQDAFQVTGSLANVIELVKFPQATTLPWALRVGKTVGIAGQVIEAAFNVREACILFFDEGESDIERALERGDGVEANVQTAKGVVLFMSAGVAVPGAVIGGHSVAAIAGSSATFSSIGAGAALGAVAFLGVGLAVAAFIIIGFDLYLALHRGPDDLTRMLAGQLWKALDDEFGNQDALGNSKTDVTLLHYSESLRTLVGALES